MAWLSDICLLAGRWDEAWPLAWQALDLARQQQARGNEASALCRLGAVHTDAEQAEAFYRQALTLADELGMRPLLAHRHLGLKLYVKMGR
jgi:tetratricopeptide (TPR) repeat protein